MKVLSSLLRFGDVKEVAVQRHDGVSSDGHLAHVFRHAAKELFGEHVEEITYRALRLEPAYLAPGAALTDQPELGCDACAAWVVCLRYMVYSPAQPWLFRGETSTGYNRQACCVSFH